MTDKPDYATLFADEKTPTVVIETDSGDVRINESEFDAKVHKLSANSHRVPAGYVAPEGGKGGKGKKNDKPADKYTIKDDATGKFFLSDKDGKILNKTPFDTAELAAAAEPDAA